MAKLKKKDMNVKQLIHEMCGNSIVMKCLERFIFQIVEEIHESQITPLEKQNLKLIARIKELESKESR